MAVTIINKKKVPPPKFIYEKWAEKHLPLDSASHYELEKYKDVELEKWSTGIGCDGLHPIHYFYLTQTKIKAADGSEIRPWWRDGDEFVLEGHQQAIDTLSDELIVKRREFGLTTLFGGVLPVFTSLVFPGSTNLITSADKTRVANLFAEKTRTVYGSLHNWLEDPDDEDSDQVGIRPPLVYNRTFGHYHFGGKHRDGTIDGLNSQIICAETVKNPQAFETYRAKSVFLDEFFLHEKAPIVLESAQACTKDGFLKVAPIVMGGSCGVTSVEGAKKGTELWENAETLKIVTTFVPGWMCIHKAPELDSNGDILMVKGKPVIHDFAPNGFSDKKTATEWILKTRETLDRSESKSRLNTFIKEYPLSIEEVFEIQNEGKLPPEAAEKITVQARRVRALPTGETTFKLERRPVTNEVFSTPDKNGKFVILEHPDAGETYIGGIDPIPFSSKNIDDGSDCCLAIKKPISSQYVAYIAYRSFDVNEVVKDFIMLQDYYNEAKAMLERNHGGAILARYKDQNRSSLMAVRPSSLGIKWADNKNVVGIFMNDKIGARGNDYLIAYILESSDKIMIKRQLEELKKFLVANNDLVDAMIMCEFYDQDLTKKTNRLHGKQRFRSIPVLHRGKNGRTETRWIKIPIKG